MSRPPFNLAAVEQATAHAIECGCRVLQTHYYAPSDEEHVAQLLSWLAPAYGATVIDAGSGLGEVPRLMSLQRPDLGFLLVNLSHLQLALGPSDHGARFWRLQADCHDLSACVPDDFAQAMMFSSALCQMDAPVALAEAFRVLASGGVLLINDLVRSAEANPDLEQVLAVRAHLSATLVRSVEEAGFTIDFVLMPDGDDAHFRTMLSQTGDEALLDGISPIIIRATKRGLL